MVQKLDFITPTLSKVLDLFASNPLQEHHEREVMRLQASARVPRIECSASFQSADF